MAEEKVYTNEVISDNPLPDQTGEAVFSTSGSSDNQILKSESIKDNPFPENKKIAREVISTSLNTRTKRILAEFEFMQSGALQIGRYENGVSGDLRISPNGLTARDLSGNTTFSIDGTTGEAVFKGTVQAGSFIAGDSNVIIDSVDGHGRILIVDTDGFPRVLIGWGDF